MQRTALVVDDSMLIRHTVCRFLEARGFAVESATNGLEALEVLQTTHPDVIVTDLSMPKMGGSELITELKKKPETACTPVMVLAAKRTTSDAEPETRADAIIYKDIDIEDQLGKALERVFTEMPRS